MTCESKLEQRIFPRKKATINIGIPKLKYISKKYGKNKKWWISKTMRGSDRCELASLYDLQVVPYTVG